MTVATKTPEANGILNGSIPQSLREKPQWVLWKDEKRNPTDATSTKVPYTVGGSKAQSNDPATWSEFGPVWDAYQSGGYTGIGFMFSADDNIVGVDLDGCRDPETGKIAEWATNIIDRFDTYTEVSPSRTGVKLFLRGKSPLPSGKNRKIDAERISNKEPGVECYDHGRYFALTGWEVKTVSPRVEPRQPELNDFCRKWFPKRESPVAPVPANGATSQGNGTDIVERARRYIAKIPPAVSGQGGHDATFHVACLLVIGWSLSDDEAYSLLAEWNTTCEPPWNEHELRHKLDDAVRQSGERGALRDSSMTPVNAPVTASAVHQPGLADDMNVIMEKQLQTDYSTGGQPESTGGLDKDVEPVRAIGFGQLADENPNLKPVVIDGLARQGEVVNIIADPKRGKSWLVYYILLSIVYGRRLFDRFPVTQGRVLLIDNELHRPTIASRIPLVAKAMGIVGEEYRDMIDVVSLRGRLTDFRGLKPIIENIKAGQYRVIVVDAYYRMIPPGTSENDNSAVAQIYNLIDQYAAATDAAWLLVHHATKGSQTDKAVTDVGAGAGSQSRAADCHLILRPHEEEGCVVLEAALRSFKPVEPLVLQWEFPLWTPREDMNPAKLKGRLTRTEERQSEKDHEGIAKITDVLQEWDHETDKEPTANRITHLVAFGKDRTRNLLSKMCVSGDAKREAVTIRGNETYVYSLTADDPF